MKHLRIFCEFAEVSLKKFSENIFVCTWINWQLIGCWNWWSNFCIRSKANSILPFTRSIPKPSTPKFIAHWRSNLAQPIFCQFHFFVSTHHNQYQDILKKNPISESSQAFHLQRQKVRHTLQMDDSEIKNNVRPIQSKIFYSKNLWISFSCYY